MNQSITLHNLLLPQDTIDHICSFLFYTTEESKKRNKQKYTRVIRDFKRVHIDRINTWGSSINRVTIFIILPIDTLIVATICTRCNNYVKILPKKHFICHCV